jgi:hypothetical protein
MILDAEELRRYMLVWPLLTRIGLEVLLTIKVGECELDARNGAVLVEVG